MTALFYIWLFTSIVIVALARKAGPWYRVIPASASWPVLPVLIGVSRLRYKRRRRSL